MVGLEDSTHPTQNVMQLAVHLGLFMAFGFLAFVP
jgi:hypothetical protein